MLARALHGEVVALRAAFEEIAAAVGTRVTGRFAAVESVLAGAGGVPAVETLAEVAELLQGISLKPTKARVRDLRRLDRLAARLAELLPPPSSP